jgi:hypothetical protein
VCREAGEACHGGIISKNPNPEFRIQRIHLQGRGWYTWASRRSESGTMPFANCVHGAIRSGCVSDWLGFPPGRRCGMYMYVGAGASCRGWCVCVCARDDLVGRCSLGVGFGLGQPAVRPW